VSRSRTRCTSRQQVLKGWRKPCGRRRPSDLKPDNIFLGKSDTDPLFREEIVDSGSRKIGAQATRPRRFRDHGAAGTVIGTPFYMCPEQARPPTTSTRGPTSTASARSRASACLAASRYGRDVRGQIILSICIERGAERARESIRTSRRMSRRSSRAHSCVIEAASRSDGACRALHEIARTRRHASPLDAVAPQTLMSPGGFVPTTRRRHARAANHRGVNQAPGPAPAQRRAGGRAADVRRECGPVERARSAVQRPGPRKQSPSPPDPPARAVVERPRSVSGVGRYLGRRRPRRLGG